jgi:hypothetical protein
MEERLWRLDRSSGVAAKHTSPDRMPAGTQCVTHKECFAVDAELKRSAKGVIDRILHLRDSL